MPAVELFARELSLQCTVPSGADGDSCVFKLEQTLYAAARTIGFEYVRYTCWHKEVASSDSFPMSFSINFSNFPKLWEKNYESKRYYLHDPVLKVMDAAGQAPLIYGTWQSAWRDVGPKATEHERVRMQELSTAAMQHGINNGFYMVLATGLSKFVISLGSGRKAEDVELQAEGNLHKQIFSLLALLNQAMNLTQDCDQCRKPLRVKGGASIKLTSKQSRILKTFADNAGATNVDVARINHVTTETIAFHLKAIRKKFNQPNASGHALSNIAMLHGLI